MEFNNSSGSAVTESHYKNSLIILVFKLWILQYCLLAAVIISPSELILYSFVRNLLQLIHLLLQIVPVLFENSAEWPFYHFQYTVTFWSEHLT